MSLLLDALKKAELAKQRAASSEEAERRDAQAERPTPVFTREKLPSITQPVEILSDDLPSANQKAPGTQPETPLAKPIELAIAPGPEIKPVAAASNRGVSESREAARRLFDVKEMEYNPKRPFYLTLIALGVVGVAYGGYVWWQLQPRSSLNAQPIRDSQAQTATEKTVPPATAPPSAFAAAPSLPPSPPVAPAIPFAAARSAPDAATMAALARPTNMPAPRRAPVLAPAAPDAPALQQETSPMAAPRSGSEPAGLNREPITISPATVQIDPQLERAYDAVQKNDLSSARQIYQNLLQRDPNNRDALLGLAAIDIKTRDYETAEARYLRLLELDPRDGHAQAGLLALRGQMDPVASESRIKNLLATQPESAHLYFALGNQYALQSRWSEAQQAYFKAFTVDPDNADYAFNLAVSLDHLRQKGPALEYYRRSLALADKRPGGFDRLLAAARVRELQK
jgi:tetratricopeptide (TPR) repeat protein